MAHVDFPGIWISDYENPADYLHLRKGTFAPGTATATATSETPTRYRLVVQGRQRAQWQIVATQLTKTQVDWMHSHEARLVWVRDFAGRKIVGAWSATPAPIGPGGLMTVTLTIDEYWGTENVAA